MTMSAKYPQFVIPLLKTTFNEIVGGPKADDLDAVLRKEALYCAIGRCYLRLRDELPMDAWLSQSLSVEVKESNPKYVRISPCHMHCVSADIPLLSSYRVLKRRIAWVLGEIANGEDRPDSLLLKKTWDILAYMLVDHTVSSDVAVRVSAAIAIQRAVDVRGFYSSLRFAESF